MGSILKSMHREVQLKHDLITHGWPKTSNEGLTGLVQNTNEDIFD